MEGIAMTPIEHLYFIYISLAIIVAAITIYCFAKKGFVTAMKGKFMEKGEEENLIIKEELEKDCVTKQLGCATKICAKIHDVSTVLTVFEHDILEIKNKVDGNLIAVKDKINGVARNVDSLRTSMEKELRNISKFMGSVEKYMEKTNGKQ